MTFTSEFNRRPAGDPDSRLDAPAYHRNHSTICAVIQSQLAGRHGDVLEIGSGTGQHAIGFARAMPDISWWPSDPNPRHRASIDSWAATSGIDTIQTAADLDAAAASWPLGQPGWPPASGLVAMIAINVLHIAPWAVTHGLLAAAARHLAADGQLIVYGPFKIDGEWTAESNVAFDRSLRSENPEWGVRDTIDLSDAAAKQGLTLATPISMPSNNFILTIRRQP